jgi:Ca2+/H+ antiporter
MAKLILLSVILIAVVVPVWLSTRRRPRRALRTAQLVSISFVVVWAYLCVIWYPQLVPLE